MIPYQPSEGLQLGSALACWANSLDRSHHEVGWFLRCWEQDGVMTGGPVPVRSLHARFMRLRRELAPYINTKQVEEMDHLIGANAWNDPSLATWQLHTGYTSGMRPWSPDERPNGAGVQEAPALRQAS